MAQTGGMNILKDCIITLIPGGDDDGEFVAGGPVVFKCDLVRVQHNPNLQDHSTNQDQDPMHRITKKDWTATFETKLNRQAASGVESIVNNNELAAFRVVQKGSSSTDLFCDAGILGTIEWEFKGPNTIRFEVKPYGLPLNFGYSLAES